MVILTSKLMSWYTNLCCAVSTRTGGVSPEPYNLNLSYSVGDDTTNVKINREHFFRHLNIQSQCLAKPHQRHSDSIKLINRPGIYDSCDALITAETGVFLSVLVADCCPIFLFDPVTQSIAIIHTGWRGSKSRIVSKVITKMRASFGVRSKDLIVYHGPCAGVCCYEVDEEVAVQFDEQYLMRTIDAKPHLNLTTFNRDLLLQEGVRDSSIEISGLCTICSPGLLHSYRRAGACSGRMIAVIGLFPQGHES